MSRGVFSEVCAVFGITVWVMGILFLTANSVSLFASPAGIANGRFATGSGTNWLFPRSQTAECAFGEFIPEHAESTVPKYEKPAEPNLRAMAEITLLDFNKAVQSRDFSLFHATIADQWKAEIEPEAFSRGFSEFLEKDVDISRIEGFKAVFDPCPNIGLKFGQDVLFIKGIYGTEPLPVRFNLEYILDDYQWKLVFISVSTKLEDDDDA